jgi:hypothetical protein
MKEYLVSYATPFIWTTIGLIASLFGVLLLFRFGMPFRLSTGGGGDYIVTNESSDPYWVEPLYKSLGWMGLLLIVIGTVFQIVGAYIV